MTSLYFEQTRSSFMDLDKNSDFKDFGGSNNDGGF